MASRFRQVQSPTARHTVLWAIAYRWIEDAGEKVVYLLPDGEMYYIGGVRKTIPKAQRTGVYSDVFTRVKAYKEQWYVDLRAKEAANQCRSSVTCVEAAKAEKQRLIAERESEFNAWQG